jgi:hypothetical protein
MNALFFSDPDTLSSQLGDEGIDLVETSNPAQGLRLVALCREVMRRSWPRGRVDLGVKHTRPTEKNHSSCSDAEQGRHRRDRV